MITDHHKNDMRRLIEAMNGEAKLSGAPSPSSDKVMASILNNFRAATADDAPTHSRSELATALVTEATTNGVRIGSWEIDVQSGDVGKYYQIIHTITREPIASDLRLYDAARAIASALNEGKTFTSPEIRKIIAAESEYSKHLMDAVQHAKVMKNPTSESRRMIAESRYNESRHNALKAKNKISKM